MNRIKKSLFFKDDKDVYDALVQKTPSKKILLNHLKNRGLLLSEDEDKTGIAEYISPFFTGFFDQKFIVDANNDTKSNKKFASVGLDVDYDYSELKKICDSIKKQEDGLIIQKHGDNIKITQSYTKPDYSKNVLSQNTPRMVEIEIEKNLDGTVLVRSNNDEQAAAIVSKIKKCVKEKHADEYNEFNISFSALASPVARTKFFSNLIKSIKGYRLTNVKMVAVSKESRSMVSDEDADTKLGYIRKAVLNGGSVNSSEEFLRLVESGFYVTRIEWTIESDMNSGDKIDLYAEFKNIEDCSDFIYSLQRVYKRKDNGDFLSSGSSPSDIENSVMLPKIELAAKISYESILSEYGELDVTAEITNENNKMV